MPVMTLPPYQSSVFFRGSPAPKCLHRRCENSADDVPTSRRCDSPHDDLTRIVRRLRTSHPRMENIRDLRPGDTSKVNSSHRDQCAYNLRCLNSFYGFSTGVLSLATYLLDQFVTKIKVHPRYVSCIASTCFHIAANSLTTHEQVPSVDKLVAVSQVDCRASDILRMEGIVRKKLSLPPVPDNDSPQPPASNRRPGDGDSDDDNKRNGSGDDDDDELMTMSDALGLPATPDSLMDAILRSLGLECSEQLRSTMHSLLASLMCRSGLLECEFPVVVLAVIQCSFLEAGIHIPTGALGRVKLLMDIDEEEYEEGLDGVARFLHNGYNSPCHLPRQKLKWTISQRTRNQLQAVYMKNSGLAVIPETPYDCCDYSSSSEESLPECSTPDIGDFCQHFSLPSSPFELSPMGHSSLLSFLPLTLPAPSPGAFTIPLRPSAIGLSKLRRLAITASPAVVSRMCLKLPDVEDKDDGNDGGNDVNDNNEDSDEKKDAMTASTENISVEDTTATSLAGASTEHADE